ncbi:hypothetical protein BU24DRAFT_487858 [Aaosphaeria arxii CBS 175.79]|uniref:Uncharacterized protein n=1 Tax=Aaosphaeria arxii CBS 175.79 TaxID=1450172 RepID=A0A6A5Y8V0_9PLEO|nr:uncharacterized protein BU24DRAFT_487858 [Aaosphaeria arxii CBS 175.79]KAF2021437.1 hypothetical protein BU24DRAFT_487858 [Aaosphaeria arxii CBS 175.79]
MDSTYVMDVDMDAPTTSTASNTMTSQPFPHHSATSDYIPLGVSEPQSTHPPKHNISSAMEAGPLGESIPPQATSKESLKAARDAERKRNRQAALLKKGMPSDPALQEEWHRTRKEQGLASMTPSQRDFLARKQEDKAWREEHKTEIRRARRERKKLRVRAEAAGKVEARCCIFFHTMDQWDPSMFEPGKVYVRLHSGFDVDDSHLFAIADAHPVFCAELEKVEVGSVQVKLGSKVTDAGALAVARSCPNLVSLTFNFGVQVSDQACIEILRTCEDLDTLTVTGHDSQHGVITDALIKALLEDPGLGENLETLVLVHQDVTRALVEQLSKARPELEIIEGNRQVQIVTWENGAIVRIHLLSKGCAVFADYGRITPVDSEMMIDD